MEELPVSRGFLGTSDRYFGTFVSFHRRERPRFLLNLDLFFLFAHSIPPYPPLVPLHLSLSLSLSLSSHTHTHTNKSRSSCLSGGSRRSRRRLECRRCRRRLRQEGRRRRRRRRRERRGPQDAPSLLLYEPRSHEASWCGAHLKSGRRWRAEKRKDETVYVVVSASGAHLYTTPHSYNRTSSARPTTTTTCR